MPRFFVLWSCALVAIALLCAAATRPPSRILQNDENAMSRKSPDEPLTVTSDSLAFCHDLAEKIAADLRFAPELAAANIRSVTGIEREGVSLCDAGHLRSGISRLRHALRLVQEHRSRHS